MEVDMRRIPILTALSLALAANVALAASAGQAAPEFVVNDSAGKAVRLSDYHGKFVVLEWTNRSSSEFKTGAQMNSWMQSHGAAQKAVLIDADSATGMKYAAKTTPHMFVIDPKG